MAANISALASKRRSQLRRVVCGISTRLATGRNPCSWVLSKAGPITSIEPSRALTTKLGRTAWLVPHGRQRSRRTSIPRLLPSPFARR
jgi:hypothetical protein